MRFLLILAIGLFIQTISFAQVDNQEMQKEMEKMRIEMQEQLKNFNFENLQIDTMLLKSFAFPEGFGAENFLLPNDIDMSEMLKMMERQMGQMDTDGMLKMMERQMGQMDMDGMLKMMEENMDKIDFAEMEKMMKDNMTKMDFAEMEKMMEPFMKGEFFMVPAPEDLKKEGEGENKKDAKKRKTYKM